MIFKKYKCFECSKNTAKLRKYFSKKFKLKYFYIKCNKCKNTTPAFVDVKKAEEFWFDRGNVE